MVTQRLVFIAALLAAPAAIAAEPDGASMACPAVDAPGRVKCSAELRVAPGKRITWADLVLLDPPAGLIPLKGRVPPGDATETRDDTWKLAFAVVAKQRGSFTLSARLRAVVCEAKTCAPIERDLKASVSVGE
jgi:hypothetical protein